MPAIASVTIVVDEKGAVKALDNITGAAQKLPGAFNKAGSVGNVVLTKMSEDHKRANENVRLLTESLGIGIPRALQNVITSSALARSALASAFTVGAVIAFASVAIDVIDSIRSKIDEFSEEHSLQARLFGLDSANRDRFHAALKQEEQLALQAQLATASDTKKVQLRLAADLKEIDKDLESARATNGDRAAEEILKSRTLREKVAAAEIQEIRRKSSDATRQLQNQATLASLTGIDAIREKEKQSLAEQDIALERDASLRAEIAKRKIAIEQQANAEIVKLQHDALVQGQQAVLDAEAAGLHGMDQIEAERLAHLRQITAEEQNLHVELAGKRQALEIDTNRKIVELRRQAAEETRKVEEEAAIAILPPWQRSYAQIEVDTQDRLRKIQRDLKDTAISSDEAARQAAAAWQLNFAKTRDQLAGDLESLFDDITSGNIGKRFKKMFEDMVFQMVATWILGVGRMRSASASAQGGGSGGILGALFGLGGGSGSGGGTNRRLAALPPFLGSLFGMAEVPARSLIGLAGGLSALPLFSGGTVERMYLAARFLAWDFRRARAPALREACCPQERPLVAQRAPQEASAACLGSF
jgi:hypothetical protein